MALPVHDTCVRLRSALLPFWGAFRLDMYGMVRSRLVQGWLGITALIGAAALLGAVEKDLAAPRMLRELFVGYIVLWSTVVIVISAGSVSGEAGVVADSILSRGLTRRAYILSKYLSRWLTVTAVCLTVLVPISYLAALHLEDGPSVLRVTVALLYISAHMTFLCVLGVTFSIWFRRAVVSIAVVWAICYFLGAILSALDMSFMAPPRLVRNMSETLLGFKTVFPWKVWLGYGIPSILLVLFGMRTYNHRDV